MRTLVVEVELNNGVTGFGVSIGGDAGCAIVEQHLHRFVEGQDIHNIELIQNLTHIHLLGLMTILPFYQKAQETQPLFYKMKKIQNKVLNEISPTCKFLSMGMSQDYIYALKEGATHLRIGTKLYGPRN